MKLWETIKEKPLIRNLIIFLAVLGPGIVTGSVDNDAGGITTYSVAGAIFGYKLLWTLVPSFIILAVVQEMNARMGIVTGKGLADLIRENFGVKITFFIFLGLLAADIGNTATEFAGVAGSMDIFGISKYISVPLTAVAVWILVVKGNYKTTERIFLLFSFCLLSYIVSAILAKPDWGQITSAFIKPTMHMNKEYLGMVLGIVGTTVAPWMQFYMQSAVIEKGIKIEDYKFVVADVIIGCIATIVVAFFIIVACAATLHQNGIVINEAKDAAVSLKPFAGIFASQLFAFGLFVASVFSATILPLATAFYICEAFGFEAGVNKKINEAPQFYALFTFIILVSVIIILIPNAPLIAITIWSQIINAMLLPVVLISMITMVNNKKIMGKYTNNNFQNTVGWSTTVILIVLTLMLIISPLANYLHKFFFKS
ncbi:MAG: Nramp family divalent metal transporter [Candidatus Omnitrophica bacterium]|nr:Nramp family divalent metal transporter [Candidatus Omnitrophota bacterium]MBU4303706.1 Nramp family divalent metal transporter [Candidatus Omnitrophota bacterium]MBU4467624.1 Nramp family divalent metal transporter [Candidatus Omnitrophota bacterium]MCG2707316.1 Nramp family divalent metal transporter [Candidatus Omnitrophota bacterium]